MEYHSACIFIVHAVSGVSGICIVTAGKVHISVGYARD